MSKILFKPKRNESTIIKPWSKSPKKRSAFTLVELLVVIAIITIIASVVVPKYRTYIASAQAAKAIAIIEAVSKAKDASAYDPLQSGTSAAYLDSASEANRWTVILPYLSINNAQPASIATMLAGSGTATSLVIGNSSTAPLIQ